MHAVIKCKKNKQINAQVVSTMVKIPSKNSWIQTQIRISTKILQYLPWPRFHFSTKFCENQLSSFCLILYQTNKQTNRQTNKQSEDVDTGNNEKSAQRDANTARWL